MSSVFILIALVVNFDHMWAQSRGGADTPTVLVAYVLFYTNAALTIWLFYNWRHLIDLVGAIGVHWEDVWSFIAVMTPLVLAMTGVRLVRGSR